MTRIPSIVSLGLLVLFLAGTLSSCGLGTRVRSLFGQKLTLQVEIHEQANADSPIALDFLYVFDEELLQELLQLPAKQWFAEKAQYKRDYPEDSGFRVWEWEWVPGQEVPEIKLPLNPRTEAGILYVLYAEPGAYRAKTRANQSIAVHLLEKEFQVRPLD